MSSRTGNFGGSYGASGEAFYKDTFPDSGSFKREMGGSSFASSRSFGGGSGGFGGGSGGYSGGVGGGGAYGIGSRREESIGMSQGSGYGTSNFSKGMDRQYIVKMRGLPFSVNSLEIFNFFSSVAEVADCEIHNNDQGRPAGTASVLFNSEREAEAAMRLNRKEIGNRYIELFFDGPV